MRKVIGIGETVLDIIFKGGKPIEAVPGGSSFNAVISLGRAGVNASFISEAGNDRIGEYVIQFLRDNGVNADNVSIFPESKSPLSLAFLDENNNADYIFYKDHPHDQLEFATPEINPGDIVLFGSFFALNPVVRPQVAGFLEYAKEHGAILYYDINFRASHQNEIMKITPNLIENLEMADFVRGNPEESFPPDVVAGIHMHRRIDVLTDNLPEVREAREWFRNETRRVAPITLDVMWDHFLSRHWSQLSPDFPLQEFVCYAREQVMTILPDSPPRFINLNNYLWSEQWLVRYRDMDFIQNVLNGMASRRPRLDALRDSWYDLNAHYAALETRFWQFYPRMMAQASRKAL